MNSLPIRELNKTIKSKQFLSAVAGSVRCWLASNHRRIQLRKFLYKIKPIALKKPWKLTNKKKKWFLMLMRQSQSHPGRAKKLARIVGAGKG